MMFLLYAILYVIVAPIWWLVSQINSAMTSAYLHILVKLLEYRRKLENEE